MVAAQPSVFPMAYSIKTYCNKRLPLLLTCVMMLAGCAQTLTEPFLIEPPKISHDTDSARLLKKLPPAKQNTVVSVYEFQDQTGQLKPNDNFADYSHAVTQGGLAILNKALLQAGNGHWFDVVERGGLKNLLQERQIIQLTRAQYAPPDAPKTNNLSPLLYAGMLIEGGVVGYDSNITTGGAGANYLGVGGDVKYRRDIVTVDLRAISVENGQVLLSVTSEKTIYSTAISASVFKYVSFDHLLQAETGLTMNEPPQLAVRQAIETAVYSIIMEGARKNFWQFADENAGRTAMGEYLKTINDGSEIAAAKTPDGYSPSELPQQPAGAQQAPVNANDVKSEKEGIIGKTSDFLSLGDEKHNPGQNNDGNNPYPVVPANPADYPVTPPSGKK